MIGKWAFSTHNSSSLIPGTNVCVSGPPSATCDDDFHADVVTDSQTVVVPVSSTACQVTPQYQALATVLNISHNPCVAVSEHIQLVYQLNGLNMRDHGGNAGGRSGQGGGEIFAGITRSLH